MKIGILTHYNVNNQGAQLQMYALYNKLIELGHMPRILTYNKNFDFNHQDKLRNQVSAKSIPYYTKNFLITKGLGLTLHNVRKYKINKNYRLQTFTHGNYANAAIDMAIVGSDEVFSLESGVNMMMYGHGVNTDKIISYAPSFGQTDIDKIEKYHCKSLIVSGLAQFKSLSARDAHTASIIQELIDIKPTMVCDPVLLYNFEKTQISANLPDKKYIVIYAYDRHMNEQNEIKAIRSYAKKNNLITVSAGTYHKWCDKNIVCNCLEWLEILRGAKFIITDTFHGTIVSAISNVPMAINVRDKINSNKLVDLINRLCINDRCIYEINENSIEEIFNRKLDRDKLNKSIVCMRNKSEDYLIKAIEACSN